MFGVPGDFFSTPGLNRWTSLSGQDGGGKTPITSNSVSGPNLSEFAGDQREAVCSAVRRSAASE